MRSRARRPARSVAMGGSRFHLIEQKVGIETVRSLLLRDRTSWYDHLPFGAALGLKTCYHPETPEDGPYPEARRCSI